MKIIILVLAADRDNYDQLINSIKQTWGTIKKDQIDILYYYGIRENYPKPPPNGCIHIGSDIICDVKENIPNINQKTAITFQYIDTNYTYDYIFRCCAGSYINQDKLLEFIQDKPKINFYCGIVGYLENITFASGSGYFLSRDLVKLLLTNHNSFHCHAADDVAIGHFLTKNGIKIHPSARRNDVNEINQLDPSYYHIHFRHKVNLMYQIHHRINT